MRALVILMLLTFVVALAVVLGERMSTEAMSVVIGVVCGVAAGIPMSVIMMLALTRRDAEQASHLTTLARQQAPYPPVVIVQGSAPASGSVMPPYYAPTLEATPRQFRIVGDDAE